MVQNGLKWSRPKNNPKMVLKSSKIVAKLFKKLCEKTKGPGAGREARGTGCGARGAGRVSRGRTAQGRGARGARGARGVGGGPNPTENRKLNSKFPKKHCRIRNSPRGAPNRRENRKLNSKIPPKKDCRIRNSPRKAPNRIEKENSILNLKTKRLPYKKQP